VTAGGNNSVNNSYSGPNNAQIINSTAGAGTGISINAATSNIGIYGATTGISIQSTATAVTTTNTGSGTAFGILPPYYALAYIMRTGSWI
jgi:hypothetical protein